MSIKILAKAQPKLNNIAGIKEPVNLTKPAENIPKAKKPIPRLRLIVLYKTPFAGIAILLFLTKPFKTYPVIKSWLIIGLKNPPRIKSI